VCAEIIKEFKLLKDDAVVYKLLGPVLVKVELKDAKQNISARLDLINKSMCVCMCVVGCMFVCVRAHMGCACVYGSYCVYGDVYECVCVRYLCMCLCVCMNRVCMCARLHACDTVICVFSYFCFFCVTHAERG